MESAYEFYSAKKIDETSFLSTKGREKNVVNALAKGFFSEKYSFPKKLNIRKISQIESEL